MENQRSVSIATISRASLALINRPTITSVDIYKPNKSVSVDNKEQNVETSVRPPRSVTELKYRFWWFSFIASLNHALNYVVTSYATALLDKELGGIVLGLTWSLNSLSGLTIATPAVRILGFKYAMIIALWGYALQIGTMYWAVLSTTPVEVAWTVAILGSTIAGFTSAIWWTAQGVYFEATCEALDLEIRRENDSKESVIDTIRADLSAHWTIIYQGADILVFLSLSVFPYLVDGVGIHSVLAALVALGLVTSLLGFTFSSLGSQYSELSWTEVKEAILAVPRQVKTDARVTLLSPFVFGFGITTAALASYVNDVVSDSEDLGTVTIGFLEAFSYLVAIISAFPYALVSTNVPKGQDWVIQFGSLCFFLTGVFILSWDEKQIGTWVGVLVLKGMYGLGRGVFEGSCRAVYASMFRGEDLSTAFSNQTLSAGLSGGICFFLFSLKDRFIVSGIVMGNGVLALLSYFILMFCVDATLPLPWQSVIDGTFKQTPEVHDSLQPEDLSRISIDNVENAIHLQAVVK